MEKIFLKKLITSPKTYLLVSLLCLANLGFNIYTKNVPAGLGWALALLYSYQVYDLKMKALKEREENDAEN